MNGNQEKQACEDAGKKSIQRTSFKRLLRQASCLIFLLFCAALTAFLLYLSFPRFGYAWLGWLSFFPFTWGILKIHRFWPSVLYAWVAGFVFHALALFWIYYTCRQGGGLSVGLSLGAWFGLSGLLALQMAFWGGGLFYLKKTGAFFPVLAACGWVALEWLHQTIAFYGLGFPWFMLGGTQWNFPQMLQLVSLVGVYGLSFCLAWSGVQLGWALHHPSANKIVGSILLVLALCCSVYGFGSYRLTQFARIKKHQPLLSLQTALVQPNIDQYKKWDEAYEQEILERLLQMGRQLTPGKIMLTVWPESVSPGPLSEEKYFSLFKEIATSSHSYQLVGSFAADEKNQYVSADLLGPQTDDLQTYQKIKLVPFGEFVPLSSFLQKLFPNVEALNDLGTFTPGPTNQKLLDLNGVLIGSTICYESIFPQLWTAQARQGARIFVNLTNDAWFFQTAAPYQHLSANVVRAVETGRPVLRATNTGFSAIINPVGEIEQKSGLFTQEILQASVALPVGEYNTFYTQWDDWFAWLCAAVFFTLLISTMVFAYD